MRIRRDAAGEGFKPRRLSSNRMKASTLFSMRSCVVTISDRSFLTAVGVHARRDLRCLTFDRGCINFGSLHSTVTRVGESILCSYEPAARPVDGHRSPSWEMHRPSLLKVATGFELAKRCRNNDLRKMRFKDGAISTSV